MTDQNMTTKTSDIHIAKNQLPEEEFFSKLEHVTDGPEKFISYPVVLDQEYINNSEKLCHIINGVLVMFAYNYVRDTKLQQLYQLDKELNEILLMANGIPYELGMYKLHFLYDQDGNPRINNINCQYPLEDWLESSDINDATNALANATYPDWNGIDNQSDFLNEISNQFDHDEDLFIIKKNKKDKDDAKIQALKNVGINTVYVEPKDFKIVDGQLKVGKKVARQFLLDVNREELKLFDKEVLKIIVQSGRCLNDVRTIILIHDRKILAGFYNRDIMGAYINMDDYTFLSSFLVPSFTINTQEDIDFLLNSQDIWILRSNEPGNPVYVRSNYSKEDWEKLVKNTSHQSLAQPYAQRKEFSIPLNDQEVAVNLTGVNLCFNAKYYGPGPFKTSKESVLTNTKDEFIIPCVVEKTS